MTERNRPNPPTRRQHPRVDMRADESLALIAIPNLQPQRSVIGQHPPHLSEHGNQLLHPLLGGFLQADLPVDTAGAALAALLPHRCPLRITVLL